MFPSITLATRSHPAGGNRGMLSQTTAAIAAARDLSEFFAAADYGHAGKIADGLVLERLPSGELAWLKPCDQLEPEDAVFWPTQAGRDLCARWRAELVVFGREIS
jgi:hypothetical protein